MIILRQNNFSILNKLGSVGNYVGNKLSFAELKTRGRISSWKSKKLKNDLTKHIGKYQNVSISNDSEQFLPDQENLSWEPGKEPKGFDLFAKNNPDRIRYTRKKSRGGGTIELNKNSSPFVISHEYGHSLDYAAPHGDKRFTDDRRARIKTSLIGESVIGGGKRIDTPQEALNANKKIIEREVAADINAIKLLKKKGASQKEIDRAKQEAKAALRTYKTAGKSQINYIMQDSSLSDDLKFRREYMKGAKKQYNEAVKKIDNMYGPNKLAQREKAALIGGGIAIAGLTAGGIALYRKNKKKKEKDKKKQEEAKKRIIGEKTDEDVRKAVKGTEAEKKVNKILDKSGKEMKSVSQKEYAAISDEGRVAMRSKEALEKARELGYTRKQAVAAAKRFLDRARDDMNDQEKVIRVVSKTAQRQHRNRIGFIKDTVSGCDWKEQKFGRIKIGFHPDYTETSGQKVKLGFKKFSKQTREVVPEDIVKKVKDGGGVIQKDHNGDWRIISMKTKTNKSGKPEFWPQKGSTKAEMEKILQAYQSNRH